MMEMFQKDVEEIFQKAGVAMEDHPILVKQAKNILSEKMAILSATLGLTWTRVDLYNEQKESLVQDLISMRESGELAAGPSNG